MHPRIDHTRYNILDNKRIGQFRIDCNGKGLERGVEWAQRTAHNRGTLGANDKAKGMTGEAEISGGTSSTAQSVTELQHQLDNTRQQLGVWGARMDVLARKIDDQQSKITRLTEERDALGREAKEKEGKLVRSERERGRLQQQIYILQDDVTRSQNHGQKSSEKAKLQHQNQEAKNMQTELDQVKSEHTHTLALLEICTQELKGAQSFSTKADGLSGAEVISMIEGLNSEILQTAAFIADSFAFGNARTEEEKQKAAYGRVKDLLGDKMTKNLTTVRHSDDPMLVQIALQSCFIWCSKHVIETWFFEKDRWSHQLLSSVYDKVRQAEDQAVSGKWRALTRNCVQKMVQNASGLEESFNNAVAKKLVDILITAGCQGSYETVLETVSDKFSDKIRIITNASLRINHAIGEEITSSDLEPICTPFGIVFEQAAMVDIGDNHASRKKVDRVLCVTEIGLQRVERQIDGNRSWMKTTLLLKPKVALEAVVDNFTFK